MIRSQGFDAPTTSQEREWAKDLMTAARVCNDPVICSFALAALGSLLVRSSPHAPLRGLTVMEMAVTIARKSNDRDLLLGALSWALGARIDPNLDLERAKTQGQELILLARRRGNPYWESGAESALGEIALFQHDLPRARAHTTQALRLAHDNHYSNLVRGGLELTALVYDREGKAQQAACLAGAWSALNERVGGDGYVEYIRNLLAQSLSALGEDGWEEAFTMGKALSADEAVALALSELGEPKTSKQGSAS
jgi:hypothetical protein